MMLAAWISTGLVLLVAIVSSISTHEAKKHKPNIRVPRETLWARTNRYHEGK
jgi:hypothetical protein